MEKINALIQLIISDDGVTMLWQAIVLRVCLEIFITWYNRWPKFCPQHFDTHCLNYKCLHFDWISIHQMVIKSVCSPCLQTDTHAAELWGISYSHNIQHQNDIIEEGLL